MVLSHPMSINCPTDALAYTAYTLRIHPPRNSLVIIGLGSRGANAYRFDLVESDQYTGLVRHVYRVMLNHRTDAVFLIGYGPHALAVPLLREVQDALELVLTVKDVLWVNGDRWWSLACPELDCSCPPDGTPFEISATEIAAQATFDGVVAFRSHKELIRTLSPVGGEDEVWMRAETEYAEMELLDQGWRTRTRRRERLEMAQELVGRNRRLNDRDAARLSIALFHLDFASQALTLLAGPGHNQRIEFWTDLTRRAVGRYAAGPAVLLAVAALLQGDGVLASAAMERSDVAHRSHQFIWVISELLAERADPAAARERFSMMRPVYRDAADIEG